MDIQRVRDNFPVELQHIPHWIVWKYEQRPGDAKPTKIPYTAKTGQRADSTDPHTWADFATISKVSGYAGMGFVVTDDDAYVGIDLDNCIDEQGILSENADRWVRMLDSYTEISPSHKGLRIWVRGHKPGDRCKNVKLGVEIYEDERFFTVTGLRLLDFPTTINERQNELEALYNEAFPPVMQLPSNGATAHPTPSLSMADNELIDRMLRKPELQALWAGDLSNHANDHSGADLALCNALAFYCGRDEAQIDRLFRQSGLYRPKWERQDYRERTIGKAIVDCTATYDPTVYRNGQPGNGATKLLPAPVVSPVVEPPIVVSEPSIDTDNTFDEDFPTVLDVIPVHNLDLGWINDYVSLMHELTASPKEFHLLAGLLVAATAIQRKGCLKMSFGNIYPNLYGCIVAMSTVYGKTTAINKPRSILTAALLDRLLIPSHGSSEGLIQQLSETPSALMIRDEIGTLFGSDKVKYLKDYKSDLTALYDCTPYNRRLRNESIGVAAPYLNILGATTPERFYGSISQSDWSDGLLPRWLFVVPEGEPDFDTVTSFLTEDHARRISILSYKLMTIDQYKSADFIAQGDAFRLWSDWRKLGLKAAYAAQDNTAMAIIGRYATYALKFAIILAAVNDSWGVITPDTMQTAIHLADNYKHTVHRIITEADHHKVTGSKVQKVFGIIKGKNKDGSGVTLRQIYTYGNMTRQEAQACIEQLVEYGAIINSTVGKTTRFIHCVNELQLKRWGKEGMQ